MSFGFFFGGGLDRFSFLGVIWYFYVFGWEVFTDLSRRMGIRGLVEILGFFCRYGCVFVAIGIGFYFGFVRGFDGIFFVNRRKFRIRICGLGVGFVE